MGRQKLGKSSLAKVQLIMLNVQSDTLEINVDRNRPEELNKVYDLGKTDKPKETLVNFKRGFFKRIIIRTTLILQLQINTTKK